MNRFIILVITFFTVPLQVAFAESTQPDQSPSIGWLLFKLLLSLAFILGMIFFLFRFIAKKNGIVASNVLQPLGGVPLGQNKSVQLVEIANKVYILGVGQEVRLLQVIDNPEELEQLRISMSSTNHANDRLIEWVNQLKEVPFVKRLLNKSNETGMSKGQSDSFEDLLHQKINQLKDKRTHSLQEILENSEETTLRDIEKRDSDE